MSTITHINILARPLILASTLVLMAAVTGCHKKRAAVPPSSLGPAPAPASAPTASITADPLAIDLGQSVVLNWRTTNATVVTIDGIGQVPQRHPDRLALQLHQLPSHRQGRRRHHRSQRPRHRARSRSSHRSCRRHWRHAGSEDAFHQNVQDIFFDYDSYDLRPDGQTTIHQGCRLPRRPSRHRDRHRRLLRRPWLG